MTTETTIPHMLGDATLAELEQGLRGQLIRPSDEAYDEARAIWNGAHDRRPALIVRRAGVADVMRAVEFARSVNLLVAVRGGGHSLPGFSTCDGGMVVDLSAMTAVRVDPARQAAIAKGGCTWAASDHETQAFGLAVTGGLVSSTGGPITRDQASTSYLGAPGRHRTLPSPLTLDAVTHRRATTTMKPPNHTSPLRYLSRRRRDATQPRRGSFESGNGVAEDGHSALFAADVAP